MKINNILFVSPKFNEIRTIIESENLNKNFRFRSPEEAGEEDYLWADAFVGFRKPENFSFGNIKWVHSFGAGVDKLLKGTEWKNDVLLTRTICSFGRRISEYCLSYILRDLQKQDYYTLNQTGKMWEEVAPVPLSEKTAAVYGTGVIGRATAETLASFGMTVYGVSLSGKQKSPFKKVFSSETAVQDEIAAADFIINTMPLTDKTKNMFNTALLSSWNNVFFINVGRGESVNDGDLLKALGEGTVRKAVLDVFEEEPLPQHSPYWAHPHVIVTPHISAVTTPEEGAECFIDTLNRLENGEELSNIVNLQKGF